MLSLSLMLSLSKNTMDEALLITIISLCALRLRKKKYAHRSRWSREWLLKRGRFLFENKAPACPSFVRSSNLIQFMQNVKSAVHTQRFV
jgi:hypothetical protein